MYEREDRMTDNVSTLARDWLMAKSKEAAANRRRLLIEEQIISAFEVKSEGSITHQIDGYKVTLTQPISRKVDADAWGKVASLCPVAMHPVKTKIEADGPGIKWLMENEPTIWGKISLAFEAKPGKVGVAVVPHGD